MANVVATDTLLGEVVLDARGSTTATYVWHGRKVNVLLASNAKVELPRSLAVARNVVARLDELVPNALAAATSGLLLAANDWREDDGLPPLDVASLGQLFEFDGLLVFDDGMVEFFFLDGEVFAGHAVIVNLSADGLFENARFEG